MLLSLMGLTHHPRRREVLTLLILPSFFFVVLGTKPRAWWASALQLSYIPVYLSFDLLALFIQLFVDFFFFFLRYGALCPRYRV
jgi:hypothetical protein